jgi:hypothetical protein
VTKLEAALRIIEDYPGLRMGPSVLFVLGAVQNPVGGPFPNKNSARLELSELLTALRKAPADRGVRIQWCGIVKAYVATSMPFVDGLAWDMENCNADDFDALVDRLWSLYGTYIVAGEFSIEDRTWRSFDPDELNTISDLLET